jgi:hypothetical protein
MVDEQDDALELLYRLDEAPPDLAPPLPRV